MKFVFRAGEYPNNLFIDDINMSGTVGLNEMNTDFFGAMIYPNPSNGLTTLTYTDRGVQSMLINLTDLSGRVVKTWKPNNTAPGVQRVDIETSELATGAYLITLDSGTHARTLKLMVE